MLEPAKVKLPPMLNGLVMLTPLVSIVPPVTVKVPLPKAVALLIFNCPAFRATLPMVLALERVTVPDEIVSTLATVKTAP